MSTPEDRQQVTDTVAQWLISGGMPDDLAGKAAEELTQQAEQRAAE